MASQGSEILSGQLALQALSNNGLCAIDFAVIMAVVSFLISIPRTLGNLTWYGICSCLSILLAGLVAMIGAGANPVPGRVVQATVPNQSFINAFAAITNPVRASFFWSWAKSDGTLFRYLHMQVCIDLSPQRSSIVTKSTLCSFKAISCEYKPSPAYTLFYFSTSRFFILISEMKRPEDAMKVRVFLTQSVELS